ncbi:hypothetical protein [Chroococcidiopsis sp [FACHB-1243]]|uniref:hypothetical protein n=1 Tax=Chroococcidiopsis sp. [FACHB-1243] TaxID=2692781 RepID=UPI001A7EB60C|nr:hypothetical protein [Chroococcidiopsis sp. [FACHB-1243]]
MIVFSPLYSLFYYTAIDKDTIIKLESVVKTLFLALGFKILALFLGTHALETTSL